MTLITKKEKRLIRFSTAADNGSSVRDGKFLPDQLTKKGQLFVMAQGDDGEEEAVEMVKRVIHEVFYADRSQDVRASLENAFNDANTLLYEVFKNEAPVARSGIRCAALAMTGDTAYVAQVGDIGIFRITRRRVQELTKPKSADSIQSRALGLERKLYLNIRATSFRLGDCLLQGNERLLELGSDELRAVVRSNTPKQACKKLLDLAMDLMIDSTEVQVIWVSSVQLTPDRHGLLAPKMSIESQLAIATGAFILLFALLFKFSQNSSAEIPENQNGVVTVFQPDLKTNPNNGLLAEARSFFDAGELEVALAKYETILETHPEDYEATSGRLEIGEHFKDKADLYFNKSYFEQALTYYRKASRILRNDRYVLDRMEFCENELIANASEFAGGSNGGRKEGDLLASKDVSRDLPDQTNWINRLDWDFRHLTYEDFKIDETRLAFSDTPHRKRLISQTEFADSKLKVGTQARSGGEQGLYGIIINYKTHKVTPFEEFYVFSVYQQKEFLLQRYSNFKKEVLMRVVPDINKTVNFDNVRLDAVCSGAYMEFFADGDRILTWTAETQINGKVGLYASPHVAVEFFDFSIEGR